jgi:hypothetical protein
MQKKHKLHFKKTQGYNYNMIEGSEEIEALTPTQINEFSRNRSSMGQRCTEPVEIWTSKDQMKKKIEIDTYT